MKLLKIILAIVVIALSSYGLITGTSGIIMPYVLLLMGLMLIVMGISEFKKQDAAVSLSLPPKVSIILSFILFLTAGFVIFVAIYTL